MIALHKELNKVAQDNRVLTKGSKMTQQKVQKKQTIDGMAYEEIKVALPKTSNSARANCNQAKKAYKLAKSDAKKVIKDANRQLKQAKYAYKASKLTLKAKKYDIGTKV